MLRFAAHTSLLLLLLSCCVGSRAWPFRPAPALSQLACCFALHWLRLSTPRAVPWARQPAAQQSLCALLRRPSANAGRLPLLTRLAHADAFSCCTDVQAPGCAGVVNGNTSCSALASFYAGTGGPDWSPVRNGWDKAAADTPTDYCTFEGVLCGLGGAVISMCVRGGGACPLVEGHHSHTAPVLHTVRSLIACLEISPPPCLP